MREYYYDTWMEDGTVPIGYRKEDWFAPIPIAPKLFSELCEGDLIPVVTRGPVTRTDIVKYAAASWDFNPIHHDETFASTARSGGIIAHGMMVFAYLGQIATTFLGTVELDRMSSRFMNVTRPGDVLTFDGRVEKLIPAKSGGGSVHLFIKAINQRGEKVTMGDAQATLPR